ncbi:phage baseplate assembly protein V [Chitinimonas naiadis]
MSAQDLVNAMKGHAQALGNATPSRAGRVTSYDPGNYAVKVLLLPEEVETGWLPVNSGWVGNGWGMFAPPSIGDIVEVEFLEDDVESGYTPSRWFNDSCRPLPCPSGEFWLVHKSGSLLKFLNNGDVQVVTSRDLQATVGRNLTASIAQNASVSVGGNASLSVSGNLTSSAAQWNHTGPVKIDGTLLVTKTITGQAGMQVTGTLPSGQASTFAGSIQVNGGDVKADSISLKGHVHYVFDVQTNSSIPG